MGVITSIKLWKLITFMFMQLILMNGLNAYRIIEWSHLEDGESGSGENADDTTTTQVKRNTNFVILNDIEDSNDDSTQPPIESGSFEELKKLNPGLKFVKVVPTLTPDSNKSKPQLQKCLTNDDCSQQQTCNAYSRKCERCRMQGEICRRDGNCCGGMKCLWGRCTVPKKDGSAGSTCQTNRDCSNGMCCAKEHGVNICKKYLIQGDVCEMPAGGLVFSLHHSCPCMEGLRCKINKRTSDFMELKGTCVK